MCQWFVRKDQWGLAFLRCEEPSRMPGLQLAPRLYLRHRLVDGVVTAHWSEGSCLLHGCFVSLLKGPCRTCSGLVCSREWV